MNFPDWINKFPRVVWRDANRLLDCPHIPDNKKNSRIESRLIAREKILRKCIISEEAKQVWLGAASYFECEEKGQLWLACAIQESIADPDVNSSRKSAKEVRAWEEEVRNTALKLGSLLNSAPEQRYDAYYQFTWRIINALRHGYDDYGYHIVGLNERIAENNKSLSPSQIALVEKISDEFNSLIYEIGHHFTTKKVTDVIAEIAMKPKHPSIWGPKVRGGYADRAYFVRSLTIAYLLKTNKPHRAEVATLANIAYTSERAEQALSEREVIRLTKDLKERSSEFAYLFSSIESAKFPYYEQVCSS